MRLGGLGDGRRAPAPGMAGLDERRARARAVELVLTDGLSREWGRLRARVLRGWWERVRGLLGTRRHGAGARPVLFPRCSSVHTFGMRYAIDVLMADGAGLVVASWRALPPGRVVWSRGARHTLERPSSGGPWPQCGDRLVVTAEVGGCD